MNEDNGVSHIAKGFISFLIVNIGLLLMKYVAVICR